MPPENSNQIRILKILLHVGFFLSGITTVLIGQVLPVLAAKFVLDDRQTGFFFPAQFAGSLTGTFLTNWFGKRNRFLLATFAGCFLMSAGVLMLNLGSYELCLLGFFVNGLGIGLTLPSINMLILELNRERAASALSVLNFFWGLGAIICSLTVYNLSKSIGFFPVSLALAVPVAAIGVFLMTIPKEIEKNPYLAETGAASAEPPIWTNPIAWAIAGFNFIHVGFESAIGGWLPTYSERLEGQTFAWWLAPTFLYFVFFVIGRAVAPVFFRFLNENRMLILSLLLILLGMGMMLAARSIWLLGLGAAIAGFGTSSVFPTNMSRFNQTFGESASRRAMPFFICGTLGGAFTTWFIGYVSNRFENDLRSGMFILLGSIVMLIFLQIILASRNRISDS
jgi:FHS family glucose/mannose:H+ symporter-like MFS transporter